MEENCYVKIKTVSIFALQRRSTITITLVVY